MAKGIFTVRNIDNLTTEQVKGKPLKYGNTIWGTISHADEDYLYGEFEHDGEGELVVNLYNNEKCSMEIRGD